MPDRFHILKQQALSVKLSIGLVVLMFRLQGQNVICTTPLQTIAYRSNVFISTISLQNPSAITTADNGKFFFYEKIDPTSNGVVVDSLVVFRTGANGNVLWSKMYNVSWGTYIYNFSHILEMQNGNIVLSGGIAYTGNNTGPPMSGMMALDQNGNFLWQRMYSNLGIEADTDPPDGEITEGPNSELIVVGDSNGSLIITRLDVTGQPLASYSYAISTPFLGPYADGICFAGNALYVAGYFSSYQVLSGYNYGFYLLKLDYSSGTITKQVFNQVNHTSPYCDSLQLNSPSGSFTLTDRNTLTYSRIITGFCYYDQLLVAQIDTNLNIIGNQVNEFRATPPILEDQEYQGISPTGNCAYFINIPGNDSTISYAIVDSNNNIALQRRLVLQNNSADITFLNLNGYSLQNIGLINITNTDSIQLFSTSADYVSSAYCANQDSTFLSKVQLSATPVNFSWLAPANNPVPNTTSQTTSQNFTIDTVLTCQQFSICDTLKINGRNNFCFSDSSFTFTVTKNSACLKTTGWSADTSFFSSLSQANDTTIAVQFKRPGSAVLYASLPGCGLIDSLVVTVQSPQPNVNIEGDSVICPGQSDSLYTTHTYQKYVWQDGSTNPFFVANEANLYAVTATDGCNDISSDTVLVRVDSSSLTVGPNLELCRQQDTILIASSGFVQYVWSPAEAISGNALSREVTISPDQTTAYIVTATTSLGCILSDTVNVVVDNCLNRLVVPNAFTPNNDGHNDIIKPLVFGYLEKYEFVIYNRWGVMVFRSADQTRGWDGTLSGAVQPAGTYVWLCKYQFSGENEKTGKGVLILIR